MKTTIFLFVIGLILMTGACNQDASMTATQNAKAEPAKAENAKPAVNRAEEEKALRAADLAWSDAARRKDAGATANFIADDAEMMPPNAPAVKGGEEVKKGWSEMLAGKDFQLKWEPARVQVAESGELGYTSGTYEMSMTDPKGAKVNDKGKYIAIWKKIDGQWKCFLDMYNSDLAAK